jgi:hypothetical protein
MQDLLQGVVLVPVQGKKKHHADSAQVAQTPQHLNQSRVQRHWGTGDFMFHLLSTL